MKNILLLLLLSFVGISCKKIIEPVKSASFKPIVYEFYNNVDSLNITYRVGVYTSNIKGNIDKDTLFTSKGTFFLNAQVLIGQSVISTGISYNGGDFHLKIKDTSGLVLVETDTVAHFPANPLHREVYESQIQFIPN